MAGIIAFLVGHWRLALGLLLAVTVYVEYDVARAADDARDVAVAQEALWQGKVDEQNRTIQGLKAASDERDAKAQAAVKAAQQAQAADAGIISGFLSATLKPGEDPCVAARALIWQEVSRAIHP